MDFKSIFSKLSGGKQGEKYFYTEPEIQEQEKIVDGLRRSGVDPVVITAQEAQLQKMQGKRQRPKNEADYPSSMDFLKEEAPAFAAGINTPQPPPMTPPMPMTGPSDSASGAGIPSSPSSSRSSIDVPMPGPDEDQAKRDELDRNQKKTRLSELFPQALAGFGDMVTAAGAPYGTKQTQGFKDIKEKQAEGKKSAKEDMEKKFLTDPASSASRAAQSAAARLLGKKPEELANLSVSQIDKAFPIWKEALNNEEARELKKLQIDYMKSQKDLQVGEKESQFKEKQIQQIRQNLTGSEAFKNMQKIDYNGKILEDSYSSPTAYGDLGAMFAFMKALDPQSVVREGEQERFKSTGSLPVKIANMLNQQASGKTLQPSQRKEVADFAKKMRGHATEAYKQYNKPSIEQAKRLDYNLSEIDPLFADAPTQPVTTSPKSSIMKDPKTGKRYEVDPITKKVIKEVM